MKQILQKAYLFIIFIMIGGYITVSAQNDTIRYNIGTDGSLTIPASASDKIHVISGTTTVNSVNIQTGFEGTIILQNVSIRLSSTTASPITVVGKNNQSNLEPVTKVNVILDGNNVLYTSGSNRPAFQVDQGAQIHLSSIDPSDNSKGKLSATVSSSSCAAGIGALNGTNRSQGKATLSDGSTGDTAGGNVIISSGEITAKGGHGAGIGGGYRTNYNGIIVFYGGEVNATTFFDAAGIGSGCPTGKGVIPVYAPLSTVIALPPAKITALGAGGSPNGGVAGTTPYPELGLAGTANITYIGDPYKPVINVKTETDEPYADIYADLTETTAVKDIFDALELSEIYDLSAAKFGNTGDDGVYSFNAQLDQPVTFYTDASSTQPTTLGRPFKSVRTTATSAMTIELPLLDTDIKFEITAATPLEEGYSDSQALSDSYMLKVTYNDKLDMENVTYDLQSGSSTDFTGIKFYDADGVSEIGAPTSLSSSPSPRVFYIRVPIKENKTLGIYTDVLRISGTWNGYSTGYIRQVVTQRVVYDDTETNNYIEVEATERSFIKEHPTTATETLKLTIKHGDIAVGYNASDVTARYIITTHAKYDDAIAETPLNQWTNMSIPTGDGTPINTTVSFIGKDPGIYYIHWYVTSGVIYAHSRDITDPAHQYGGFGKYIIYPPIVAGNLYGNPFVCEEGTPIEIKGEVSTGGSGEYTYQWQISTNNSTWTDITINGNSQNYQPVPLTTSPTSFRRITSDNVYLGVQAISEEFKIEVVKAGTTLYWDVNAQNNNWNDVTNWVDVDGKALHQLPVACTHVYIPSEAVNYPSLHTDDTPVEIFGLPVCENITFAYGSELIYQHNLTYEKAFVQYNFGRYETSTGGNLESEDTRNSSVILERNKWHVLAAPLKKMASGDFAFAGYPFSWQAQHEIDNLTNGLTIANAKAFNTNNVDLLSTYNAISLKVAGYESGTIGYKDQKNLQGLRGILQIPYFEDSSRSQYHPGHHYDKYTGQSKFYYYNDVTLQPIHSPVGTMTRGSEAYRFIYEENDRSIPSKGGDKGYTLSVVAPGSDNKVLIGNPLLASINSQNFYNANAGVIKGGTTYLVLDSSTETWKEYSYNSSNYIKPFQTFIVTLGSNSGELFFPFEDDNALTKAGQQGAAPLAIGGALTVKATDTKGNGEKAMLATQSSGLAQDIDKVLSSSEGAVPEVFFVDLESRKYNFVQLLNNEVPQIGLGVKASETGKQLTLYFENAKDFTLQNGLQQLVMVDTNTGNTIDLTRTGSYSFVHKGTSSDGYYIDTDRFVIRLAETVIGSKDTGSIYYIDNTIYAEGLDVNYVTVFDISGNKLYELTQSELSYVPLSAGVYIVKVVTKDGTTKSARIMVK